jgi:hypothetical protein
MRIWLLVIILASGIHGYGLRRTLMVRTLHTAPCHKTTAAQQKKQGVTYYATVLHAASVKKNQTCCTHVSMKNCSTLYIYAVL